MLPNIFLKRYLEIISQNIFSEIICRAGRFRALPVR
jgi:hypothetical protein